MSENLVITIATPDNVHEIMDIAVAASNENGFLDANPGRMLQEIYPALCRDHGLVGIIGTPGGPIEGAILMRIGKMWYSEADVLEERGIFIHQDYRNAKGGRAAKLCEFAKKTSDALGLPLIIGVLSNHRTAGKVKMYQRIFGESAGAFFLYGARTDSRMIAAE